MDGQLSPLPPGTSAPDFTLPWSSYASVSLADVLGRRVILVFYPADWEPVSQQQLTLYQDHLAEFARLGAVLLAFSTDHIWCHSAFARASGIEYPLLADAHPPGAVSRAYGAYDEQAQASSRTLSARLLAGQGGRLVFLYVLARRGRDAEQSSDKSDVERYLSNEAQMLQATGFQADAHVQVGGDIPRAIDEGVTELGAEMVAVATHGTAEGGRMSRSSIAWKALAHSPVPVLLRHAQEGARDRGESGPQPATIMVPLDGSPAAERALPVAAALAAQWQGSLVVAQIESDATGGQVYLDRIVNDLTVPVQTVLGHGKPGEALAQLAGERGITHVVMTSHGRTGLSRVIAGDVAANVIDGLSLPIIIVPSLTEQTKGNEQHTADKTAPAEVPASS